MSITVDVTATEHLRFEIEEDDLADIRVDGAIDPAALRSLAIECFETADAIRVGPDFEVQFDPDDLGGSGS